jgi:PPOX class probable F420-dependent enzyme
MHDRSVTSVSILDPAQRRFVAAARTATLATIAPDGRPRLVPICFVLAADDADGRARLYSPLDEKPKAPTDPHDLARVRDLLARPDATLLVDRWSEDWTRLGWVRLEARGTLIEPRAAEPGNPDDDGEHATAVEALREKYPQYAAHRLAERPLLRFSVERIVAWGDLQPD